ncbi:hypothetical protein IV454_19875 [Massilia antarctica]|uniref:Uncharacterized protein n=1 Tax=Massilia antarctica TaxID=2765360 RepID=A0AA49A6M6_9BURK|nr:hypothetical protein [Massilia antarctica]QPI47822.1 hypothetical protein IV454_19875 [Massilia antarctica]
MAALAARWKVQPPKIIDPLTGDYVNTLALDAPKSPSSTEVAISGNNSVLGCSKGACKNVETDVPVKFLISNGAGKAPLALNAPLHLPAVELKEGTNYFIGNELLDVNRRVLAEFDKIDMVTKTIVEDKNGSQFGKRLDPALSVEERDKLIVGQAEKYIDEKVISKIHAKIAALKSADAIRPNGDGENTRSTPQLNDIRDFKNIEIRFIGDGAVLQSVMNREAGILRQKYPDFNFVVVYGDKTQGGK